MIFLVFFKFQFYLIFGNRFLGLGEVYSRLLFRHCDLILRRYDLLIRFNLGGVMYYIICCLNILYYSHLITLVLSLLIATIDHFIFHIHMNFFSLDFCHVMTDFEPFELLLLTSASCPLAL